MYREDVQKEITILKYSNYNTISFEDGPNPSSSFECQNYLGTKMRLLV